MQANTSCLASAQDLESRRRIHAFFSRLPIVVDTAPGQVSYYAGVLPLLDAGSPEPKVIVADGRYEADWRRKTMEARWITPIIPIRKGRIQVPGDSHIYALRNRIERCFNKKDERSSRRHRIR